MRKVIVLIAVLFAIAGAATGYWVLVAPNVNGKQVTVKIPTGSTYADVLSLLKDNKVLKSEASFKLVAQLKKLEGSIHGGNYVFRAGMNNRQLVNMLKFGLQVPVKLVIYNIRTKEEFAGLVGRTLEIDSNEFLKKLNDPAFCKAYGVDTNKILSRFIVDNYEFYWNIPMDTFIARMERTYNSFWNEERKAKAVALSMTPTEVTTLASIVEKEVIFDKEMVTVAGVYLNRIKIGMPLQADPTLVFALRDFSARRVNQYHKEYDSPYNTYMYSGLPPGQICMPRKKSIDAVLNAEDHEYLYFCANPDMSGYSIFSKNYNDQINVANQYRRKLTQMNIH